VKKFKILLITQSFSTIHGGGETVFSIMAKSLAESGNKVWVITSKLKGGIYPNNENIKFVFIPPVIEERGGIPPTLKENITFCFSAFRKGLSLIKKENIDIIHSNNYAPSFVGSFLSFFTSKPNILVIHDVFTLEKDFWNNWVKQKNISKLNKFLGPIFEKMIIRIKSAAIHTVSEASKDDLLKFGAKKLIYVINNAIEINEIKKSKVNQLQFIYIGRLIFYKNLEIVFKAIKILSKTYPEISLIIVGGGPYKEKLEKMVMDLKLQNNIQFKGHLSDEEKNSWITSSQALVFPSMVEGFGLVVLEAFMFEKPVLVANIRPLSDIVSDKITGLVLSHDNEQDWAKAMEEIILNPEKAHEMGLAGRKELEKKI